MMAEVGPGYQTKSMDFKKGAKGAVVVGVVGHIQKDHQRSPSLDKWSIASFLSLNTLSKNRFLARLPEYSTLLKYDYQHLKREFRNGISTLGNLITNLCALASRLKH